MLLVSLVGGISVPAVGVPLDPPSASPTLWGGLPATLPRNAVICGWEEGSRPQLTLVATGRVVPLSRQVSPGCHGAEELLPAGAVVEVGGGLAVIGPVADHEPPRVVGGPVWVDGVWVDENEMSWDAPKGVSWDLPGYIFSCVWDSSSFEVAGAEVGRGPLRVGGAYRLFHAGTGFRLAVVPVGGEWTGEPVSLLFRDGAGNEVRAPVFDGRRRASSSLEMAERRCVDGQARPFTNWGPGWW